MSILSGAVYAHVAVSLPSETGNYFEIGVFNGTGFATIAQENPEKKCYAVDPFIEDGHTNASSGVATGQNLTNQKQNFLKNTKDLSNITLYETTSAQFAQQLTDQHCNDMNISIVTIDGDHHYNNVIIDFDIAIKLIGAKTGHIVVDDTNVADVKRAYDEFTAKYKHRIDREITAGGATMVILIQESND